ncbi:MAG: hypothetical protein AAFS01_08500 [Pseudomonadota bacterium]
MKKTLTTAIISASATLISTAGFAQDIPLNTLVSGTTGAEISQGQTAGALVTTSTLTTSVASTAADMLVSGSTTTTTN